MEQKELENKVEKLLPQSIDKIREALPEDLRSLFNDLVLLINYNAESVHSIYQIMTENAVRKWENYINSQK